MPTAQLSDAEFAYAERVVDSLHSGKPCDGYLDALHDEVDRALVSGPGLKLTVGELVQRTADRLAMRATEDGRLGGDR